MGIRMLFFWLWRCFSVDILWYIQIFQAKEWTNANGIEWIFWKSNEEYAECVCMYGNDGESESMNRIEMNWMDSIWLAGWLVKPNNSFVNLIRIWIKRIAKENILLFVSFSTPFEYRAPCVIGVDSYEFFGCWRLWMWAEEKGKKQRKSRRKS